MPNAYATEKLVKFWNRLLKQVYEKSVFDSIVNRDYEGEVKGEASIAKIPSLARLGWKNYSGSVSYDSVEEIVATFTLDQKKYNAFKIKDVDKFEAFIKDPKGTLMTQLVDEFKKIVDTFVLGFYADVGSGNWYGTSYTTGTVAITAVTGAVVGTGTTFTAGMVGKPFKAAGHTTWYRVKTFTDATNIVIEDDKDDVTSAYTGGTIAAGATYEIQSNTVKTVDNSSVKFLDMVIELKTMLDEAEVPEEGRWLVIPPRGEMSLLKDSSIKLNVPAAYESLVQKGFVTMLEGFQVFRSNRVSGDNTTGYQVLAGSPMWLTFADGLQEGPESMRLESDFGTGYRELRIYGAKVADERRKFAAKAFVKFS
jgi:hypothetical protein